MEITIKHDRHDRAVALLEDKLREAYFEVNIPSTSFYNKAFIMGMIYAFDKTNIISEDEVRAYVAKIVHIMNQEYGTALKGVNTDDEM